MARDGEVEIGRLGVDSGKLWLGDPCYVMTPVNGIDSEALLEQIDEKFSNNGSASFKHPMGHEGLGVAVLTGGDGVFTAYGKLNKHGQVKEIRIPLGYMQDEEEPGKKKEEKKKKRKKEEKEEMT